MKYLIAPIRPAHSQDCREGYIHVGGKADEPIEGQWALHGSEVVVEAASANEAVQKFIARPDVSCAQAQFLAIPVDTLTVNPTVTNDE